jgi:hypothetical protein
MERLGTGQPFGSIVQFAYHVEDAQKSMRDYIERLGVGPWFVAGPFTPTAAKYRGKKTDITVTLCFAYSGHMQIELIQQHSRGESVFTEAVRARGYGFHHWGVASRDYEADVARYQKQGFEIAYYDEAPMGMRVAYMDTTAMLPGMVELIEANTALDQFFTDLYSKSQGWDGRDPIRQL